MPSIDSQAPPSAARYSRALCLTQLNTCNSHAHKREKRKAASRPLTYRTLSRLFGSASAVPVNEPHPSSPVHPLLLLHDPARVGLVPLREPVLFVAASFAEAPLNFSAFQGTRELIRVANSGRAPPARPSPCGAMKTGSPSVPVRMRVVGGRNRIFPTCGASASGRAQDQRSVSVGGKGERRRATD